MLRTFVICLLFLVVLAAAPYLAENQGSVSFYFADYQITITLFTFILGFLLTIAAIYLVEAILKLVCRVLFGWIANRRERLERKAAAQAELGLRKMVEGDYSRAQRLLKRSVKNTQAPFFNLIQTFEVAVRNRDLKLARASLEEAIRVAEKADEKVLEVCKLKFYVASENWEKALQHVIPLKDKVNTEEVNLLAAKVFQQTNSYGRLEDLVPYLVERGYINEEQERAYNAFVVNGFIDQIYHKSGLYGVVQWWDSSNQPRKRLRDIYTRNLVLERFIGFQQYFEAINVACETLRVIKPEVVEATNFVEIIDQIKNDTLDQKLAKTLAKYLAKYSQPTQVRFMRKIAELYYAAGNLEQAKVWFEKLLDLETSAGLLHSPEAMLLAQVIYRKTNDETRLLTLNQMIDGQYVEKLDAPKAEESEGSAENSAENQQDSSASANKA